MLYVLRSGYNRAEGGERRENVGVKYVQPSKTNNLWLVTACQTEE